MSDTKQTTTEINEDPNLVCEDCGQNGASKCTCPYAEDIHGEEVDVCLCDGCYQERAWDI